MKFSLGKGGALIINRQLHQRANCCSSSNPGITEINKKCTSTTFCGYRERIYKQTDSGKKRNRMRTRRGNNSKDRRRKISEDALWKWILVHTFFCPFSSASLQIYLCLLFARSRQEYLGECHSNLSLICFLLCFLHFVCFCILIQLFACVNVVFKRLWYHKPVLKMFDLLQWCIAQTEYNIFSDRA